MTILWIRHPFFQNRVPDRLGWTCWPWRQGSYPGRQQGGAGGAQKIGRILKRSLPMRSPNVAGKKEQTAQLCQEMLESINTAPACIRKRSIALKSSTSFSNELRQRSGMGNNWSSRKNCSGHGRKSETAQSPESTGCRLSQVAGHANQLARQDATGLVQRWLANVPPEVILHQISGQGQPAGQAALSVR